MTELDRPRRLTRFLWGFLGIVILADIIWLCAAGMTVAAKPLLTTGAQIAVLLGLSLFYTRSRPDTRLAELTHVTAAWFTGIMSLSILSYLTVTLHRPLIDETLVAWDHALGLDWLATYTWVAAQPLLHKALSVAYASLLPQLTVLILLLNFKEMFTRGWETLWAFLIASALCIFVSALWPAMGAFGHFHVEEGRGYVRTFQALHEGRMTVIGAEPIEGLVQFPSLHAALAIIFTYAARGLRFIFPVFILVNIALFISTAPVGGHHFADLWGGIALALAAISGARTLLKNPKEAT